jgi:hypothetical protein
MVSVKQYQLFKKLGVFVIIAVYMFWTCILIIQFLNNLIIQDYSIFKEYSQISLTLFAITLIGGIFEGKIDDEGDKETILLLFKSSILFLISFIGFLFTYSFFSSITEINIYIFVILFFITIFTIVIFVTSLLQLWYVLTDHYLFNTITFTKD